jgi:hypothetical protein
MPRHNRRATRAGTVRRLVARQVVAAYPCVLCRVAEGVTP